MLAALLLLLSAAAVLVVAAADGKYLLGYVRCGEYFTSLLLIFYSSPISALLLLPAADSEFFVDYKSIQQ